MRISDWSSDVCSSDLSQGLVRELSFDRSKTGHGLKRRRESRIGRVDLKFLPGFPILPCCRGHSRAVSIRASTRSTSAMAASNAANVAPELVRSEEHTSELQSLMRISYAVFCLKTKINTQQHFTR